MKKFVVGYGNGETRFNGDPRIDWNGLIFNNLEDAKAQALEDHKAEARYQKERDGYIDFSVIFTYVGEFEDNGSWYYDKNRAKIVYSIEGRYRKYNWE